MPGTSITVNDGQAIIALGQAQAAVSDRDAILNVVGELQRASIARTFRDEGSPAGSWPALAASTLRKKGYTAGHKLLILSGRLFNSITYAVSVGVLTIGTNVIYAAVQQFGSADRGGGEGPQARIPGRSVRVSSYDALRVISFRQYGTDERTDKNGVKRTLHVRAQGADSASRYTVGEHDRFQNIPGRPYLVIRPEDPARWEAGIDAWFGQRMKAATA